MFLHAGRDLNQGLKALIKHDEKTPEALENLVDELHNDKELAAYQLLNHPGSEDLLWGIIRLLASKDPRYKNPVFVLTVSFPFYPAQLLSTHQNFRNSCSPHPTTFSLDSSNPLPYLGLLINIFKKGHLRVLAIPTLKRKIKSKVVAWA